jgi:transcriptional regulator with XRE-family HTH domain
MTFRNNYNISSAIRSSPRLLTNDEPRPKSRSKFGGSEKPKVGHKKDLAKKVGCSQQAVSAVEQAGYKRHSLPLLRRIAAVLDADVVVALVPRKAA